MVILLVVMGAVFSLLFVLNSIRRAVQGREKVGFFETLLAFLALVFPVLALVNNNASAQPLPLVNMAAIGLGVIVAVVSILTLIIESRKPGRALSQRRGVLGIGLGILIVAATFVAPAAAKLQVPTRSAASTANNVPTSGNVNISEVAASNSPTPTLTKPIVVPTNTPDVALLQMSATPTRLASPMPTATNTPFVIATSVPGTLSDETSESTGQAPVSGSSQTTGCLIVTRQNVNLRSGAGTTFDLLLTIPFSTTLNAIARNKASDWWFVSYQGKTGWVSGEFVNADSTCATLPVKASE